MATVQENLQLLRARIAAAARRVNRAPEEIKLLAVSKRVAPELIQEAVAAGQPLFGENYLQEALDKMALCGPELVWHFIGHLQSNKCRVVAEHFACVETVDRLKLATSLQRHAAALNRVLPILIQVNIGREPQKSGVLPEDAPQLLTALRELTNLQVRGLMAMPPFFDDPEQARPYFRRTRELAESLAAEGLLPTDTSLELSMGMSGDFEVAIEEGATLVRVGTALFGSRT